MRHLLWLCLCLASCLPLMAAPAIPGLPETVNGGKPVTIVVDRLRPLDRVLDAPDKAEAAIRKAFQERYPNATLKRLIYRSQSGNQPGEFFTDTDTRETMDKGIGPDILTVNFRQSGTYIRKGYLRPLDEQIAQWRQTPLGEHEFKKFFSAPMNDVCCQPGPDGNKHWYAVSAPMRMVAVLFRAKDKLRAAGIDAEHPPRDWDEFYKQSLQVCDPRPQKEAYAYTTSDCWFLTHMLWSAGSDLVGVKDGKLSLRYNDDAAVRALQFAWILQRGPWAICPNCSSHFSLLPKTFQLARPTLVPPDKNPDPKKNVYDPSGITLPLYRNVSRACPRCHRAWTVGQLWDKHLYFEGVCTDDQNKYWTKVVFQLSFLCETTLIPGTLNPEIIGVSRVPADPVTHQSRAEINSTMYGINGALTDPGKIEAAWAYIRFRASYEAQLILAQAYQQNRCSIYLNPDMMRHTINVCSDYLPAVQQGWSQTYEEALKNGKPEPYAQNMQQIYGEMDKAWFAIRALPSPDPAAIKKILDDNVAQSSAKLLAPPPRAKDRRYDISATLGVIGLILALLAGAFVVIRRVMNSGIRQT